MPIFRYHCRNCNRELELLLPRFDAAASCPECGSTELEKLATTFAPVNAPSHGSGAHCPARDNCPGAGGGHGCGCGNCGCCHGH